MLSIHDQRLPVESRRWIADAQDGVSVALAWADQAAADVRRVEAQRKRLIAQAIKLTEAGGTEASRALIAVATARGDRAETAHRLAVAELALARAKQLQANVETATRNDLATYDLEPIRVATEAARARARQVAASLEAKRQELAKLTATWWSTYASWLASGGRREVIWLL